MFQGAYIYSQFKKGLIPDIFIQDPKYFDEFRDEIRHLYGGGIMSYSFVAIHLRVAGNPINPNEPRYEENPFYVNLTDTDYYEKAIKLFPKNATFDVFSDDRDFAEKWVRENLKGRDWMINIDTDPVEVLNKMAGCQGIIMANSSIRGAPDRDWETHQKWRF